MAKKTVSKNTMNAIDDKLNKDVSKKVDVASDLDQLLENTANQKFYEHVEPMLATLVDKPFDDKGWVYEIKWDGYRAVGFIDNNYAELKSRNDKSFNEKFYPIYEELKKLNIRAVVDGEIVVVGNNGQANFGSLQNWRSEADGDLIYYVFDILWYDGHDLKELPLTERKAILRQVLKESDNIQISKDFETSGIEMLDAAKKMGLEGIMAKRKTSSYHIKNRTKEWLKIKANKRQEVIIGGFTKNDGTNKLFSSLLVGVYEEGKLIYTGKVGTGFNKKMQREMMEQFKPLITDTVPFSEEPDVNKPSRFRRNPPHASVTWLQPKLIGEVSYAEITSDNVMRHPSFQGMRSDKGAENVILEKEKNTEEIINSERQSIIQPRGKSTRKTLLNPSEASQVKKVNGHELKFTNVKKIFWPKEKITKGELINYYYQIAPIVMPYLKERPESMNRFPNGIDGKSFYFKNVKGKVPEWMDTFDYYSDEDQQHKEYLIANNEATLLYMINMGCIELNPWSSTVKKPDYPTFCIIDLDPDQNSFDQVIEAAQVTKSVLDGMGIPSYPKTSGSTGLHIYIPLGNKYTYEQSKEFARIIVTLVNQQLPDYTSIERHIADRKGKMYLDFLQNRPHATIACAYSVRPKPGATVSMPLHWDEVKKGLKMSDFTIKNSLERIQSMGDIFKPVLGKGIDLKKVISQVAGYK
jgi:bifunctional non-homologous end joining protein LigD